MNIKTRISNLEGKIRIRKRVPPGEDCLAVFPTDDQEAKIAEKLAELRKKYGNDVCMADLLIISIVYDEKNIEDPDR